MTMKGVHEATVALDAWVSRVEGLAQHALGGEVLSLVHEQVRPQHEVTRALGDSVTAKVSGFEAFYGPTLAYARVIELGKRSPHSRPAFPWFAPNFVALVPRLHSTLFDALRSAHVR